MTIKGKARGQFKEESFEKGKSMLTFRKNERMGSHVGKICLFDAFGTLFKVKLPVEALDQLTGGKGTQLLEIWRSKQLEYTWLRGLMAAYVSFDQVTEEALTYAMRELAIEEPQVFDLLMPVYRQPEVFPDVEPGLKALHAAGYQLAILSNGTRSMLEAGVQKTGLGQFLTTIFSVEEVQTFKPSPKVYQMPVDFFGRPLTDFLFFSSNRWDIAGAATFGFSTAWVNRQALLPELIGPTPTYTYASLEELRYEI